MSDKNKIDWKTIQTSSYEEQLNAFNEFYIDDTNVSKKLSPIKKSIAFVRTFIILLGLIFLLLLPYYLISTYTQFSWWLDLLFTLILFLVLWIILIKFIIKLPKTLTKDEMKEVRAIEVSFNEEGFRSEKIFYKWEDIDECFFNKNWMFVINTKKGQSNCIRVEHLSEEEISTLKILLSKKCRVRTA